MLMGRDVKNLKQIISVDFKFFNEMILKISQINLFSLCNFRFRHQQWSQALQLLEQLVHSSSGQTPSQN